MLREGQHTDGSLSKARDVLYNTQKHTLLYIVSCTYNMEGNIYQKKKNMYVYIMSKQTFKILHTHHTLTHTRMQHYESAAWRGQCIHTEGQAEKDRWWWCTSGFKSQGTPRWSPGCCTLSRKTSWSKTVGQRLRERVWQVGKHFFF